MSESLMDKISVSGGDTEPAADVATDATGEDQTQKAEPTETAAEGQEKENTEQDKDGETVPDGDDDESSDEQKKPDDDQKSEPNQKKIDRKINKLVSQREKQRARAEQAEQRAIELQQRLQELEQKANADRSQMSFDERIDHDVELATERRLAQRELESTGREVAEAKQGVWDVQVDEFRQSTPDYDDVVSASKVPITPVLRDALLEMGPQYVYALAKNPEVAQKLAKTTNPIVIANALNGLTAQNLQPQAAPAGLTAVPTTPAPGNTGNIKPSKKPWELDIADYMANQRKKGLIR